jgi:hypothetical protein
MSLSKKLTCKETLRLVFICLRPPPLSGFCLGWSSNFVGSEYGQIPSLNFKLLQNMVNSTQHSPTLPSPSHTLSVYTVHGNKEGGGGELERRLEGAIVHKAGLKIPT